MSFGKQVQRGSLALVVLAALLALSAAQAVGPRQVLQMPVSCGQTWDASTYDGHWPDEDSIDLAQRDGDGDNISGRTRARLGRRNRHGGVHDDARRQQRRRRLQ